MDAHENLPSSGIDRRQFLKLGAALGVGALLTSCVAGHETATPSRVSTVPDTHPEDTAPQYEDPIGEAPTTPRRRVERDPATTSWSYNFQKLPSGSLPAADWNFETGVKAASYNKEAQVYTSRPENVRIENGVLVLEARKENFAGRRYTSARINTEGKFSFQYGHLDVDMMLPQGVGTWPAAWLLPRAGIYKPGSFGIAESDPNVWALNGEIDFEEAIGSIPRQNIPATHSYNSLQRPTVYTPVTVDTAYTAFHKYGVTKTPDAITFTLDGKPYATRTRSSEDPREWPFNQPYYLVLNLAMGGDWAGTNTAEFPPDGIDSSAGSWQLKVRSIEYAPL